MIGITGYGGYIPFYRLKKELIASSWRRRSLKGERSVANNDEDCITMAVEAGRVCLHNLIGKRKVDALFFASTTSAYLEKMNSSIVASALDCDIGSRTADFANSLRAGTTALKAAFDSVASSSAKNVLVTASDMRSAYPKSDEEQLFGDGSAALMAGSKDIIASLESSLSLYSELMDVWRNPEDVFVRSWESRWILTEGYQKTMNKAISSLMEQEDIKPEDISKAILYAPDLRSQQKLAKALGFDPQKQLQDPFINDIGNIGAAQVFVGLIAALEESKPGDLILLGSYGDGADVFLFKVTNLIKNFKPKRSIKKNIADAHDLDSYEKYLSYRGILPVAPGEPFRLLPSSTSYWRDRKTILRCYGSKCNNCGKEIFPINRVCYDCKTKDDFVEIPFSNRIGTVFTFSLDNLAGRSDDPVVIQTIAEFGDQKARIYAMMTDCDQEEVKVGMKVELTFRNLWEGAGFHNYFWKLRPVR